jgi:hypothetical protein
MSDPLPPSAALPLTRGENRVSPAVGGRGSLTRHLSIKPAAYRAARAGEAASLYG